MKIILASFALKESVILEDSEIGDKVIVSNFLYYFNLV